MRIYNKSVLLKFEIEFTKSVSVVGYNKRQLLYQQTTDSLVKHYIELCVELPEKVIITGSDVKISKMFLAGLQIHKESLDKVVSYHNNKIEINLFHQNPFEFHLLIGNKIKFKL